MKTKYLYNCVVLITLLLTDCVPIQAPDPTPSHPLLPTAVPVTEPTNSEPTTADPTPGEIIGPGFIQLGDLTMEIYERIMKAAGVIDRVRLYQRQSGHIYQT